MLIKHEMKPSALLVSRPHAECLKILTATGTKISPSKVLHCTVFHVAIAQPRQCFRYFHDLVLCALI